MMKDLVNSLKPKFDVILFDSPPVLSADDAVLISKFVDGVIFVLNSGFVKEDIVKRAKERFEKFKVNVLGMVMNRFDAKRHGYSYNPYDRYYYISR